MKTISQERRAGHVETAPVPAIKRRRGRPSEYEPWMLTRAAELAHGGATDAEIIADLKISSSIFYVWMRQRPDFMEAIRSAKDVPDERVKRSLFDQALAGNTTAAIFWLKNRRPHEFRDRQETELIVPVDERPGDTQQDVRKLALAAIALIREAPDAPLIDATPIASYDTQEEDSFGEETEDGIDIDL